MQDLLCQLGHVGGDDEPLGLHRVDNFHGLGLDMVVLPVAIGRVLTEHRGAQAAVDIRCRRPRPTRIYIAVMTIPTRKPDALHMLAMRLT